MIYSDISLRTLQEQGYLPKQVHIGPSSVDLTLSNSFCVMDSPNEDDVLDALDEQSFHYWAEDTIVLAPMEFVLASTNEEIGVPVDCAAYVEGRSSVGRMGVQVQNQSKFPIRLSSGMRICQLVYVQMTTPSSSPYNGKYQFQKGATESRLYQDLVGEVIV